jgi:hypothetical protein
LFPAVEDGQRSLLVFGEIGWAHNQAILYRNIGCVQRYKGNVKEALATYHQALTISVLWDLFRMSLARLAISELLIRT